MFCLGSRIRPTSSLGQMGIPKIKFIKLDIDGAYKKGWGSGGGVVRDSKGDWIIGFSANYRNIQVKDSPTAEAHTLKDGLDLLQRIKEGRLNLTMQRTMNEDLLKEIL